MRMSMTRTYLKDVMGTGLVFISIVVAVNSFEGELIELNKHWISLIAQVVSTHWQLSTLKHFIHGNQLHGNIRIYYTVTYYNVGLMLCLFNIHVKICWRFLRLVD